ncbi:MAG: preprotein translocase subunit YajC [Planctomycetota bacterium]|nr:preprotein translocase subunit YajC [Planctomycetota bacterium]
MASYFQACWLIAVQVSPKAGAEAPVPGAEVLVEEGGGGLFGLGFFLPAMLVIMVLWIMLMKSPQQREQAKTKEKMAGLKKNDRVVTAGGIIGTVVNTKADTEYLTIRIDETNNVKMQILKQSIVRVMKDDEKEEA